MLIITDNIEFANVYLHNIPEFRNYVLSDESKALEPPLQYLIEQMDLHEKYFFIECNNQKHPENSLFDYLFLIENANGSHYDLLIDTAHKFKDIKLNILCLAGKGNKFHGFRNRHWESLSGNIHLSVLLSPNRFIENFAVGFLVLSAVSVVQTIDEIEGLRNVAHIKWVNDIVMAGAKVSGVLAQTLIQGERVKNAILGIGLNVESKPQIEATPFVPSTACLKDFAKDDKFCSQVIVVDKLVTNIRNNYEILLSKGIKPLLEFYKSRSIIIGKKVRIWSDEYTGKSEIVCEGIVKHIGDNLELTIQGYEHPIVSGRLELL